MSCLAVPGSRPDPVATSRIARMSPRSAFLLQASITLSFLAGSSAPTPLYAVYRAAWNFSPTMLTVAFAIYAIAVLAALLVGGRLSDHVGRRPVLVAATLLQALAMGVFATAGGLADLLLARVIQGLSAGIALSTVGAGLLDIDKTRGAVANAVAPMTGTALGGMLAGAMVQYLPAPLHLVYALLATVYVAQGVAVLFIAETAPMRAGAWTSLRPQWQVPAAARGAMLLAVPPLVAVWSLAGFYGSLGPTLVRSLAGSSAVLLGGLALFVLAGSGALTVLATQSRHPRWQAAAGAALLLAGVTLVLVALHRPHGLATFLAGTAIAGMGFGAGFQGALRGVVSVIEAHERAGVLSVVFVLSYLAMGVPAVAAGYGLAHRHDIVATASTFGTAVLVLAALSLAGSLRAVLRARARTR
jgi:MFS family permease